MEDPALLARRQREQRERAAAAADARARPPRDVIAIDDAAAVPPPPPQRDVISIDDAAPPAPPRPRDVIAIDDSDDEVRVVGSSPPPRGKRRDDDDDVQIVSAPPPRKRSSAGPPPRKRPSADGGAPRAKRPAADDDVEVLSKPPPPSASARTFSCLICMEDVGRTQAVKFKNCGHAFCVDCTKGTVKAAIDERKLDERLRCPDTTCKKPLDTLDVRRCTVDAGDRATWERYQEVATLASLDVATSAGSAGTRRCPAEKCNYTFQYEPHPTSGTLFICPSCEASFCLNCPVVGGKVGPAHDNHCLDVVEEIKRDKEKKRKYEQWSRDNALADEKFKQLLNKERRGGQTKPCPRCKQPLTKNGGCDHMSCPCGHQFYWSNGRNYP